MADNYAISCLVGVMDHLWFHQMILSSDPSSLLCPKILEPSEKEIAYSSSTNSFAYSSTNSSQTTVIFEDYSSVIIGDQDKSDKPRSPKEETTCAIPIERPKERPTRTRLNLLASKTRAHSSSPSKPSNVNSSPPSKASNVKRLRNHRFPSGGRRLNKTMSCKSLCELELEEVKGFMDLGFSFDEEHMNKRMMSVIPGLQRLELAKSTEEKNILNINFDEITRDDEIEGGDEGEKKQRGIVRPYLSEAWLIKRPDSPLLNLRIPRVSTAADMKKRLKYWARTVAYAIQLES